MHAIASTILVTRINGSAITATILIAKFLIIVFVFIVEKFFLVNIKNVFQHGAEGAAAGILASLVRFYSKLL